MSDLMDFLTARLEDDEAWAKAGLDAEWPEFNEPGTPGHHARALADIEAKRRIVELHPEMLEWCQGCANEPFPCRTLVALATVYADHPDFRDEWRP